MGGKGEKERLRGEIDLSIVFLTLKYPYLGLFRYRVNHPYKAKFYFYIQENNIAMHIPK